MDSVEVAPGVGEELGFGFGSGSVVVVVVGDGDEVTDGVGPLLGSIICPGKIGSDRFTVMEFPLDPAEGEPGSGENECSTGTE